MSSSLPWLNNIYFCHLRFFYRSKRSCSINWFLGPEIRGSIGHQLKQYMNCLGDQNTDCDHCRKDLQENCLYAQFYVHGGNETKPIILQLGPSVRGVKNVFHKGDILPFDIVLIGNTSSFAFHMIVALGHCPLHLGEYGAQFDLTDAGFVDDNGGFTPVDFNGGIPVRNFNSYPCPGTIEPKREVSRILLTCHTPVRITQTHKQYLYRPQDFNFKLLISRMLQRSEDIASRYCDWQFDMERENGKPGQPLARKSETVRLFVPKEPTAHYLKIPFRNKHGNNRGGIVGALVYEGDMADYLGLLNAACCLGFGKGCTAGFGLVSYSEGENHA